ncbi:MAG: class I SAM-dependent methyltransferase, partial [Parachlamydiaceae bacterium]
MLLKRSTGQLLNSIKMNRTKRKGIQDDTIRKIDEQTYFDKFLTAKGNEVIFYDTPFLQYLVTDIENYAISQLANLKYKKLLVYGCGVNLKRAIEFINRGAMVYMIDISPRSIELVLNKVKELDIGDRIFPIAMDCEDLKFAEGEFDAIYGRAILHHLNFEKAMSEIRRVLKEGGVAVFIEPLGMNPLINLYRKLTPGRRTPHEKPLNLLDL